MMCAYENTVLPPHFLNADNKANIESGYCCGYAYSYGYATCGSGYGYTFDYGNGFTSTVTENLTSNFCASAAGSVWVYMYVARNPIRYIDPDGREIWIYYDEDDEKKRMLYTIGMRYDGSNSFVSSTVNALNQLASEKFGGAMIGQLQNSELGFNISFGEDNAADANFFDPNMRYEGGIYMTGADITWNGQELIGLGHELGHGWDAMSGYDTSMRDDVWDNFFNIPEREVRAVHMENLLRTDQRMDLRTHYDDKKRALVEHGRDVLFGYDYQNSSNIPWNYGNGIYGTRRTTNPYIRSIPIRTLTPTIR